MKNIIKNIPKQALLIDILSDASFAKEHIRGAKNFCVYEIAFLDKMQASYPDKKQLICLYGWSDKTEEAARAYYLLAKAGYENVWILEGGLKAWKDSGRKIESGDGSEQLEGTFAINLKESVVEWSGRNIGKKHTGTIPIKDGLFSFRKGLLEKGEISVVMDSILNRDLTGVYREMLIRHLKSDDFFFVEKFPEAKLEFKKIKKLVRSESRSNFIIEALLTIKEITREISFEAFVHEKDDRLVINAHFDIDKSKWQIKYGSSKFFSRLGMHIVDDIISFDLILFGDRR